MESQQFIDGDLVLETQEFSESRYTGEVLSNKFPGFDCAQVVDTANLLNIPCEEASFSGWSQEGSIVYDVQHCMY